MTDAVDALRKFVLSSLSNGSLAIGARLPGERELAARFALSRAALRDALVVLEQEGHIERKHGSGTYVGGMRKAVAGAGDEGDVSPAHLMDARLAIEPQFAELVVAHATAADFEVIEDCNRRTAGAQSAAEFSEWNRRLHQAIATATRNEFLIQVFRLVARAQQHPAWGELSRRPTTAALRREYQREHDAIVAALKARNVEAARAAISNHLRHARRVLLER
jgi:DNA-binding FadR family transcriptional regulator